MTYNTHQAQAQMSPHGMNPQGHQVPPGGTYAHRAQAPKQGSLSGVVGWGIIGVICLLVAGVFASEASKHNTYLERQIAEGEATQQELKTFKFDANGNVAPQDRLKFELLMGDSQRLPGHIRAMRGVRDQEVMVAVAAFAFAAGASFLAWRNRPRSATA